MTDTGHNPLWINLELAIEIFFPRIIYLFPFNCKILPAHAKKEGAGSGGKA
jgi:hypothetical protein